MRRCAHTDTLAAGTGSGRFVFSTPAAHSQWCIRDREGSNVLTIETPTPVPAAKKGFSFKLTGSGVKVDRDIWHGGDIRGIGNCKQLIGDYPVSARKFLV